MNVSQSHASANSNTYSLLTAQAPSKGLMESHMNVLKLVEIKSGLTWHIYWGKPLGSSLPGESAVLLSFSRCLSAGLACCYQACQFNPINGPGQNATRLVVFSFKQEHIDVASKIDPSLTSQGTWHADDGLTEEVKKYLDLALQNLIERMLHSDGYVTLGTWFCRHDLTSDRQFLYRLNYFNQESSCVCAAVSVMELYVRLRTLTNAELAEGDLKGRKVVLSPCGISGQLTGRSFTEETQGSLNILSEWKLLYPNMFLSPATPPLLEVLIAGVCMKYPTQFVLSYTQEYPDTHKHNTRGNSHPVMSVRDLIDSVYSMEMQNGGSEYLPWNRINLDFGKSSTSSPGGERLSLRADTPSYLTQDRKPSIIHAPSPFMSRMASSEVMDLTHSSTPGSGNAPPSDGVFPDRKKSNASNHQPPQTLKIAKEESTQDDSVWRAVAETNPSRPIKRAKCSATFWFYTLPDSIQALETLYDPGENILDYDCSGIQHSVGALGYGRGIAVGRAQAAKTKKGRTRTRSEKSSTSKTPTSRKKRPSKSEAKKQQTPTGREDKPPELPLAPDKDMPPPASGSYSNGSASNLPELPLYNDITEMRRTPVLDVLVPTPTALNTQFSMPDPPAVFTPGPYSYGCNSSPSTDCTPQHSQSQGHRQPVFPGPPSAHGAFKHQMPEQIFETDDEDSIPIDSSLLHPMDPAMRLEADLGKKSSHPYSKNPGALLLEDTLSILTPPSNGHSPANGTRQTIQPLDSFVDTIIFELVPESFGPCHSMKTDQYAGIKQYQPVSQSSPITNKRRFSICRDLSQLTDNNTLSNTDGIRSRSSSRGVTDATGPVENPGLLPGTPGVALPSLTKSVSEPHSLNREISDSLRRPLSSEEALDILDTPTRVQFPETHALLLNLMLLDPPISPYPPPITPFPPPISSQSVQPNHFTFPPLSYAPPDELLSLDSLLTYGTARDHSLHTLEFYEDRLVHYFPVEYLNAFAEFANTGWNPTGTCLQPPHTLTLHSIRPEPLPIDLSTTPLAQEHPRTLSHTLELIQRHCLSAGCPILPLKHPPDTPSCPGGVSDLYDRQLVASTLRECCRLYAESAGEDTLMEVAEETSSGPKESSSPATNGTNGMSASAMEASQSETETSERPESEGSQQDEDEDEPLLQLDFSLDVDNDGSWLATLQQSSDNKTAKLLRKLQSSLPKLMLHGRTHSPLTWTELLRILSPVQSSDTPHCSPVPIPLPSLLAGQDTDWVEVAPYDVTNWDKLSLSPYSTREDICYLVVSPAGERNVNRVSNYFKQLSLVYQDSELGRHRPIPYTNTHSEGVCTFAPPSFPLYLEPDSLSAIKHLLSTVILPQLSGMSWPLDKQRKDTDTSNPSLPSNAYRLNSTGPSSSGEGHPSVVLYLLNTGAPHQQVDIMRVFSEALLDNTLSADLSRRLTLCVVPAQDVITQRRISTQSLRALCFDVFSKCRYFPNSWVPSRGMNFVEDCDDWRGILYQNKSQQASVPPVASPWMYRPPYILAKPLSLRPSPVSPSKRTDLTEFNLGQKSSNTLFCGYCVSPGNSYLLAVCCDSQGSLLDSAVIGLRYPGKPDAFLSREQSLRDLWKYILSILRQTVLSWHVVITRLGRPSNEELRDLKRIVRDLESVQTELTRGCVSCSCKCNTHIPSVQSVHLLSFQPEKNFRVFLNDTTTSIHSAGHSSTHILVQPGPNCLDTYTQTDDFDLSDNVCFFDDMTVPGQQQSTEEAGEDISIFDIVGPLGPSLPTPGGTADSVDNYHAVGYVLSSASAGPLPAAFWGETRERNAFFRAQLHGQFYLDPGPDTRLSYEESLKKILEQCDALSWLALSPDTGGRVTALPLHLYTLCNLYQLVAWLITKQI